MIRVHFNGVDQHVESIEGLDVALDRFDGHDQFEVVCAVPDGRSLTMLRSGGHAWLMYLRFSGDSGFHSMGRADREGVASFRLSNGQVDEYPVAWCIDVEQGFKAVAYFFVNNGACAPWISWQDGGSPV